MINSSGIRAGKAFVVIKGVDQVSDVLSVIGGKLMRWGSQIASYGQKTISRAILGMVPMGMSSNIFAGFDDAMRKVEARSTGTAEEMGAIRDQAKDLGATTAFTARQIGMLQAKIAQKGFSRSDILAMTEGITSLAIAAGEGMDLDLDATQAADAVTGVLRMWQLTADQSPRIADLITATINSSNFTLEELMTSLQYAGPVAKQFNMSLEDVLATLAGMRDLNIDSSIAGTAFRNMLAYLTESDSMQKFNDQLSDLTGKTISFTTVTGDLRNLPDILFDIGEAVKDLNTVEQGNLLGELFGVRAMVPAMALMKGQNPFKQMVANLKNSANEAQRTRELMDSGLGGGFRNTWSAIEAVGIALGEVTSGPLLSFLNYSQQLLNSLESWIMQNRRTAITIGVLLIALLAAGAAMFIFGKALTVVGIALVTLSIVGKATVAVLMATYSVSVLMTSGLGSLAAMLSFTSKAMISVLGGSAILMARMMKFAFTSMVMLFTDFSGFMFKFLIEPFILVAFYGLEAIFALQAGLVSLYTTLFVTHLGTTLLVLGFILLMAAVAYVITRFISLEDILNSISSAFTRGVKYAQDYGQRLKDMFWDVVSDIKQRGIELGQTLITTWKGVMDALEANDFELALTIGLKGAQIVWEQTLDGMLSYAQSFSQDMMDIWTNLTRGITDHILTLRKATASFLLDLGKDEGFFGDIADLFLGVDLSEEAKRADKLGRIIDPTQELQAEFDKEIQANLKKWNDTLVERDQKRKESDEARKKRLEELKAELATLANEAASEKAVSSALQKMESRFLPDVGGSGAEQNALLQRLLSQMQMGAQVQVGTPPTVLDALTKGTSEAIKEAQENRHAQLKQEAEKKAQIDQLKQLQDANKTLKDIDANLKLMNVAESV